MAAFLRSQRLLRYPYWHIHWLQMANEKCFKNGIYVIFGINDTYGIWIIAFKSRSIWVSKEALGSQEYSHIPYIIFSITCNAENLKCVIIWFFLCIFWKILCIFKLASGGRSNQGRRLKFFVVTPDTICTGKT